VVGEAVATAFGGWFTAKQRIRRIVPPGKST
jgi:hypothetical protein